MYQLFRWSDARYYRDLLFSCAAYCLNGSQILEHGEIAELIGDGVIYRVNEVSDEECAHFGHFGALRLVRLSSSENLVMMN